jgi:phosphatidylglycerophosphatase A
MKYKRNIVPAKIWQYPDLFIAFGFGSGAMPFAPGTFGTLAAIPFYLLMQEFSLLTYAIVLVIAILIGCWVCDVADKALQLHDHPGSVYDEFVGYWLTMFAAPKGWLWIILGFALFRLFDIWKPQPIRWLDEHVKGGIGVIVDDLAAAVPAWIILQIIAYFMGMSRF